MRIILDDVTPLLIDMGMEEPDLREHYDESDTIPITDEEWDEIGVGYEYDCWDDHEGYKTGFSQYLKELLELKCQ